MEWKTLTDVSNHKYILNIENIDIPDKKRISIEYYLNRIYHDLINSFVSDEYLSSYREKFK